MFRLHLPALALALVAVASGCTARTPQDDTSFTLYRNSVTDASVRVHVATFDALQGNDSNAYNRGNCEQASTLFQAQSGVTSRFWCEPGRYTK